MEAVNSNSALISLMGVPGTERVYTVTPWPDLEGLQGTSGLMNHGVAVSKAETMNNFIEYENTFFMRLPTVSLSNPYESGTTSVFSFGTLLVATISELFALGSQNTVFVVLTQQNH